MNLNTYFCTYNVHKMGFYYIYFLVKEITCFRFKFEIKRF